MKAVKLPESKIELLFEMSWKEFESFLDRAAARLSENLKLPGFRPGKAPRKIVEKEIGQNKLLTEAAELAVKKEYSKYVLAKNLEVIGPPQFEVLKLAPGNPFCFRAKAEVLPEIELPDYKKIASQVEKKEVQVSEKEVEETLRWLQKSRAEFRDLKRPSKKGDFVEIEYSSPQIENNRIFKDRFLLGKGHFVANFEQNLVGMRSEEEKEFSVDFPKDSLNKGLAGKKVNFRVKVKKVQAMDLPELNDEFARNLGKFTDLSSLKKSLREGIKKEKEIEERERQRAEILQRIVENSRFEVPEVLIEFEKGRMFNQFKERVESELKMSFQDYLVQARKTEQELKNSFSQKAREKVKNFLILREIGRAERIEVEEQEVEETVNEFLIRHPGLERTQKEIDPERLKEYYREVIYNEKVFEKLESFSK